MSRGEPGGETGVMGAPGDKGELGHCAADEDDACRRSPVRIARAEGAKVGDAMLAGSALGRIEAGRPSPDSREYGDGEGDGDGAGELSIRALTAPIADD